MIGAAPSAVVLLLTANTASIVGKIGNQPTEMSAPTGYINIDALETSKLIKTLQNLNPGGGSQDIINQLITSNIKLDNLSNQLNKLNDNLSDFKQIMSNDYNSPGHYIKSTADACNGNLANTTEIIKLMGNLNLNGLEPIQEFQTVRAFFDSPKSPFIGLWRDRGGSPFRVYEIDKSNGDYYQIKSPPFPLFYGIAYNLPTKFGGTTGGYDNQTILFSQN